MLEENLTLTSINMELFYRELPIHTNNYNNITSSNNNSTIIANYLNNITSSANNNFSSDNKLICDESEYELAAKITPSLAAIFFSIIAITGFFGNSLVILVVLLNSYMHSTTNLLIVNLACADLLFVIFCIPFTAFDYLVYKWPFGIAWCKIVQYLIVVTVLSSIYTLVLMSIDRFLAIVYPVKSRSIRTEFLTKIAIGLLWTTILIISIPVLLLHKVSEYKSCNNITWIYCAYDFEDGFLDHQIYSILFFTVSFFLPLILISVLYIKIVSRIWRTFGGKMSAESQKGRRRVTRVVIVVVLAFALLWFPIQILLLLKSLRLYETTNAINIITILGAQTIAYTSSCINPILYAFLSENFRKAFQKTFHLYQHIPIDKNSVCNTDSDEIFTDDETEIKSDIVSEIIITNLRINNIDVLIINEQIQSLKGNEQ